MAELQATQKMKTLLKQYFQDFFSLENNQKPKIAWCTSVGPAEVLIAMGYKVYYPENHGAMLGATRLSSDYIPVANAHGYSPDICSYLTADIGSYLRKETPLTKAYGIPSVPPPDILVYSTNQCHEVNDWFNWYARKLKVPCFGIHPPWKIETMDEEKTSYVESQIHQLISLLEEHSGKKMDYDHLGEIVALSGEASKLWRTFLEYGKLKPSPISFFDGCIQMAPAVVLRGSQAAVDYYRELTAEVKALPKDASAVSGEKTRLYWDGMPIWGKLRFFSDLFARLKTCVTVSTYCNSWIFDEFSDLNPVKSMAAGYTKIFINRSENFKEQTLVALSKEFQVDGILFHDAKTCPYNSNSRFAMPERLITNHKIPCLTINGDLNDLRCFSEEQTITSIETFVEQIADSRRRAGA